MNRGPASRTASGDPRATTRRSFLLVEVFGLLLTALSLAVRADVDRLDRFVNLFTTVGVTTLLGGLLASVVAYSHTQFKAGPSSRDIQALLYRDVEEGRHRESVLLGYRDWIRHNRDSIERDSTLLFVCQVLLIVGIAFLAAGILAGV